MININGSPGLSVGLSTQYMNTNYYTKTDITSVLNSLTVNNNRVWGTIQVVPNTDSYETTIGFYRYVDKRISAAGDAWVVGQGPYGNTANFTIGTVSLNTCLKIDTAGLVTVPYGLTIGSTNVLNKFNNYYLKTDVENKLADYFTKIHILSTTDLQYYYTKPVVDDYIDAKIDSSYVQ